MEPSYSHGAIAPRRWSSGGDALSARTGNGSSTNGNILGVASHIQEKCKRRMEEQENLKKAKEQLQQIRKRKDHEVQANRTTRKSLLEVVIARHQTELELYRSHSRLQEQRNKIRRMEETTQTVKDETELLQTQFQNDVEEVYAPHQMEMERYRDILQAKNKAAKRHQEQSEKVKEKIRGLKQARFELRMERTTLLDEKERFQKEEWGGLQEVASLATKVREALSKVRVIGIDLTCCREAAHRIMKLSFPEQRSNLRSDLRRAKEEQSKIESGISS